MLRWVLGMESVRRRCYDPLFTHWISKSLAAAQRGVTDRRVNQVAFNLVEKLLGPAPIIIMSSLHSVSSPRLSIG